MNDARSALRGRLIVLREASKIYQRGDQVVAALDGINLEVPERGMVALVGASGSGKSSLLHIVGAMDRPTSGEVTVAGQRLDTLPESALTAFRRDTEIGASGSGKSSLLHIVGAMDRPTSGEVTVAGQRLDTLPESALTAFRRDT